MDEAMRSRVRELFRERWDKLGVDGLLPAERDYALLWSLDAEASDGGLDQYFLNSSGDHAVDTVDALRRYGHDELATVLRRAMEALPGGWCGERAERVDRLKAVPGRWDVFRALDEQYDLALAAGQERAGREPRPDGGVIDAVLAAYRREGLPVGPDA